LNPLGQHRTLIRPQAVSLPEGGLLFDAAYWDVAAVPPSLNDLLPLPDAIPVTSGGRQAAWYVRGAYGDAVLRHYRRGGAMARMNRQTYLWLGAQRTRAFVEWRLLAKLYGLGLAVPRPLAAGVWRHAGVFYTAAILTERILDVRTLAQFVHQTTPEKIQPEPIAAAIAAMHDAGVWHADLNAHNVLIDAQGKVWLIDFDRGRDHQTPLAQPLRAANLQRLRRSLEKVAGAAGLALWRDLDRAYANLPSGLSRD